ncbi:uncharacterized protein LOC114750855 isoform X2 [Neltuma alba]|uniref:uncharacterized protein LOC114750855 isoform X2 n=1 Tax=Neltuma alba TaxID=207710 RepID=UPI0010A2BEA4|nr:uncharacterized protein LOC114750855 isoform X2 [Prosopis alba]
MKTFDSTTPSSSRTGDSRPHSSNSNSSPLPPSVFRLWRPAAQRNLRNQWSKLSSFRNQWLSLSSAGRSHATSLVNSLLSERYIPNMDLGVLSDWPDIRKRACFKLSKQQELLRCQLLSTYKDMVAVVSDIINTTRSMRCFFKGANNSPLLQFSSFSEDKSDSGDGGGVPVFLFLSIASHEKLAQELVQMFKWELCLKRLLIIEFLSIGYDISQGNQLNWSNELYGGEFDHLQNCNLYCEETCGPVPPRLRDGKSNMEALKFDNQPKPEVLQVYLTTWLAEVNIDTNRVDEIFAVVGEEMHVSII